MVRFKLCIALVAAFVLSPASPVKGGDGFPPFGAWVYGTGHLPAAKVTRVRTVYRPHAVGWHGWGGYGNIGYTASTRVHYAGFHHHFHYRPYVSYRVGYPSYFYYRPYPIYTFPIYTFPVYSAPIYYAPTCATPTIAVGYGIAGNQSVVNPVSKVSSLASSNPTTSNSVLSPTDLAPATNPADTGFSARLVSINADSPNAIDSGNIPAKTLRVADTILRIGGYREAAQAYARLANKYGDSDLIYGRRFVAQAAAGDVAQAEVVLGMAEAVGFRIRAEDLPDGNLDAFLNAPVLVASITEKLASRALERSEDPLSLKSVATWLNLSGDRERADIFLRRAEQLEQTSSAPKPDLNETVLASFE